MPTLVANAQGSVGPGTPLTIPITVPAGTNQLLVVKVSCVDNTDKMASGATVTYNGTSMGSAVASEPAGDRNFAYAYVLAAPTTGTHNVVVTPSSSSYLSAFAEVWDDVHQTTPVLSSDHYAAAFPPLSPTALTRTITIASGNVAADMMTVRNSSATVTPAGTAIGTNAGVSTISTCKASYTTGSASQTSWTINQNNATSLTIVLQPPAPADTTPPTITGPGGATGATSSASIAENTTAVHTFTANESVTWSLNGGADAARFTINSSSGALAFSSAPDYEAPTDADTNNVYVVVVRATDGAANTTDQTVSVTVTDVFEGGGGSSIAVKSNYYRSMRSA